MHLTVPSADLVSLLNRLKPIKAITTTGFTFPIYTIEAEDNKLRLIVSDNATLTAAAEIFCDIKEPGVVSVNGADFYQLISKIPVTGNAVVSKSTELFSTPSTLTAVTNTLYTQTGKSVKQSREFLIVNTNLLLRTKSLFRTVAPRTIDLTAGVFMDIIKPLVKVISNYTSDIASLAGILLRSVDGYIKFAVSDGYRVAEAVYKPAVPYELLDVVIPKATCQMLQALLYDGDELQISTDLKQIKFSTTTQGLTTTIISSLLPSMFPPYDGLFTGAFTECDFYPKILHDNIVNVRKAIEEEPFRVNLSFNESSVAVRSLKSSHLKFSNEGIPLVNPIPVPAELTLNSLLLENSLEMFKEETARLKIPEQGRPIVIESTLSPSISLRMALAQAVTA